MPLPPVVPQAARHQSRRTGHASSGARWYSPPQDQGCWRPAPQGRGLRDSARVDSPEGKCIGNGDAGIDEDGPDSAALQLPGASGPRHGDIPAACAGTPDVMAPEPTDPLEAEVAEQLLYLACRARRDPGHPLRGDALMAAERSDGRGHELQCDHLRRWLRLDGHEKGVILGDHPFPCEVLREVLGLNGPG